MTYYKIQIRTTSGQGYSALQPILKKSNVVKRHTEIIMKYDVTIKTKNDNLVDDILANFEANGVDPSEYSITSSPYERKTPKKRKSKRTP
ncbi:MAG: hypothetical protein IIT76_14235 [Prevotella sp.]|jgi:hypothetical protein|nr:hypothetical protein [Prevotella sp.]